MAGTASVKSAARVFELLEFFASIRRPAPLKEICGALRYPQSSTTALLKTLTSLGYLTYNRRRHLYFPTARLSALGDWIPASLFGQGKILEIMRDIHSETGETVSITIQNDIYLQYIRLILSTHAIRFHVDEGTMRLLPHSVIGWTLMSTMTDGEIENIVRRARIAAGPSVPMPSVAEMVAAAARIRREKYAYGENVPFLGGAAIAVLLPVTVLDQPVVLCIGGPLERMRAGRVRHLALLRGAVRRLAAR